ncbi:ankyrin repeat domain-containing protein [Frankia sp. Cr2]|uniref:ankyrin repeat domain-containing protein n=1 Tax=Frankia sp. Cr2 TaxID=3073932 RepID=UPI002AD3E820|nr:ankyrin repeat domain-containing protein [Frankia sp. Cr2]
MDRMKRTPLHYAAIYNDVERVVELLAEGYDQNAADIEGFTPLHFAAQDYSVAAARALLDAGATIDSVDKFGNTPLSKASFNSRGRGELISLLRERGADPWRANNYGQTPVGLARLIANYPVAQFFEDLPEESSW